MKEGFRQEIFTPSLLAALLPEFFNCPVLQVRLLLLRLCFSSGAKPYLCYNAHRHKLNADGKKHGRGNQETRA